MKSTLLGLSVLLFTAATADTAFGAWSLSTAQRRQYLEYYAPLIMKSAAEGDAQHWGYDWITNFDFDRDGMFKTNKAKWETVDTYVANPSGPEFATWKIRPTLYSSIVEFAEGTQKSVILIYHVYHAKEQNSIHDWERIEIRVNNLTGTPGTGSETVAYVVITRHSEHTVRLNGHPDLNFHQTATGKHAMIWQAEWAENSGFYRAELHFVENSWATIAGWNSPGSTSDADVDVNATSEMKDVHYVFVPASDGAAVTYWNAQNLSHANASSLAAKKTTTFARWSNIKRITYELQDLADIMPTHVNCTPCTGQSCGTEQGWGIYDKHWESQTTNVWLTEPLQSESMATLVPDSTSCNAALKFYTESLDTQDPNDDAHGYPTKSWFWGTYELGGEGSSQTLSYQGAGMYHPGTGVTTHRPCPAGYNQYWCQHDYYAHEGPSYVSWVLPHYEYGRWLPANWNLDVNGGFDGRWVQLFADNP